MICLNCGNKISDDSINCPHCGASLSKDNVSEKNQNSYFKRRRAEYRLLNILGIVVCLTILWAYINVQFLSKPITKLDFLNDWIFKSSKPSQIIVLIGIGILLFSNVCTIISGITKVNLPYIPWIGGILIAAGFLTSPCKGFAFLGLLDSGIWIYLTLIKGDYRRNISLNKYLEQFKGNIPEEITDGFGRYNKEIDILFRSFHMVVPYRLCEPYYINQYNTGFAIIYDDAGYRYFVLDTEEGINPILFPEDKLVINNVKLKHKVDELIIEIRSYSG